MSDVNLMPSDYSRFLATRRLWRRFVVGFVLLLLLIVLGKLWLNGLLAAQKSSLVKLQAGELLQQQQVENLQELQERKKGLEQRLNIIQTLRHGPSAVRMFSVIDRAINERLWFSEWTFMRPREENSDRVEVEQTGYFVIVPADKRGSVDWRNKTIMEIKGGALRHADLADFVSRLLEQPEVIDAAIRRSATARKGDLEYVEFEVHVLVNEAVL